MSGADPTCYSIDSCSANNNNTSSKMYKGVRKRKWGKWVSEIRLPNSRERIWLGSYDTQEKAARAFDAALYCLRGKSASFNFPDTPLNLDINVPHQSLSPQEIQEVAAKFANNHPPLESAQEEPLLESQSGGDHSFGLFESNKSKSNPESSSLSIPMYDCDYGTMQVDHGDLEATDWTFFNMLDDLNGSDFRLYFGPDKMPSGDLLYSTQPPLLFEDNNGDEIEGGDTFSNHSYLWSWNF
ncbi:ethylene-responsive transcription factor ERF018-like [Abrus precatorius]|uniref:Ethylene-responsive transcription factor ERF018-like n=1 Tax=Abrus precatorius TaxID=3816 RepID=A0A8B8JQ07_ABRPR|nr:ethylene-responsive transcription factor ERF018-like [Abrus precatorius]